MSVELDRTTKNPRTATPALSYRVVVETGRDTGASILIDGSTDRVLVGTSPSCQLRLSDPHVSRRHIVLEQTPLGLSVVDIGSTNGTSIHGVRVREAIVDAGALIAIGDSTVRIEPASESSARLPEADSFGRMIGLSGTMRRLFALGHQLAKSSVPVLVEGEAGTGKALFVETLHEVSERSSGPFVVFDAASVPATRAAPILFDAGGLWAKANGGTLLIAEPALLPGDVQRRLVRLVERREPGSADVRLVVTSRGDLDAGVEDGRMREDFFHLFVGARVAIPPVRARRGDVEGLARHLWTELGGGGELSSALLERLQGHAWPGNVRELESVIARHASLGEFGPLPRPPIDDTEAGFIERVLDRELPISQGRELLIEHFERRYVGRVLKRHEHIGAAAAASGLAQRSFRTLKAKYGYGTK